MNTQSLSPDEIRAAAETHRELGPEYQSAVIESFLDRVGREIDARVDARLAAAQLTNQQPAKQHRERSAALPLAIVSMVLGIPLTAIAVAAGNNSPGFAGLLVIWIAITIINVAYSRRS